MLLNIFLFSPVHLNRNGYALCHECTIPDAGCDNFIRQVELPIDGSFGFLLCNKILMAMHEIMSAQGQIQNVIIYPVGRNNNSSRSVVSCHIQERKKIVFRGVA
jgi:hypothetical protein